MLQDLYPDVKTRLSPLYPTDDPKDMRIKFPKESFIEKDTFVVQEKYFRSVVELQSSYKFLRAGAHKDVVFAPEETKCAIVTCGGLCPGLNVVIKGVVECLSLDYDVSEIWGIRWGYRGFYEDEKYWIKLDKDNVKGI